MAQIRPYIAQVSPQAEIPSRNAQASDIGGPGVEHLGQSIQQAGYYAAHAQELLEHQEDQRAMTAAQLKMAKFRGTTAQQYAEFEKTVSVDNTNVHGTFWNGGATASPDAPEGSPANTLRTMVEEEPNQKAKNYLALQAVETSTDYLHHSINTQTRLAGVAAVEDTNTFKASLGAWVTANPMEYDRAIEAARTFAKSKTSVDEGVRMKILGDLTESTRISQVQGIIQLNPQYVKDQMAKGEWPEIPVEKRQILAGMAETEINGREADRIRKEAEVERKKRIVSENLDSSLSLQESSSHESDSQVKPVSWTDIKEAGVAGLDAGSQQRWQSKLLERASRLNTGEIKTDIGTKLDLFKRMGLPPGDPRKLTDSAEIDAAYLKRRLSDSDHDWLAKKFFDTKSPDGDKLATDYGGFYKRTEQLITKPGPFGIYADPSKGLWLDKFIADTDLMKQQYIKQGKDPRDLINPTKPEYRGRPDVLKDYTSSAFGAMPTYTPMPAVPGAPPRKSLDDIFGIKK